MATLKSEDEECVSSLTLAATGSSPGQHAGQRWQAVTVRLVSGSRNLTSAGDDGCLMCREPKDELSELSAQLLQLAGGERQEVLFEPAEPSFELSIKRTREGGLAVHVWLDAGNEETGFYRWDAAGIRFYTTAANVEMFARALSTEFS